MSGLLGVVGKNGDNMPDDLDNRKQFTIVHDVGTGNSLTFSGYVPREILEQVRDSNGSKILLREVSRQRLAQQLSE